MRRFMPLLLLTALLTLAVLPALGQDEPDEVDSTGNGSTPDSTSPWGASEVAAPAATAANLIAHWPMGEGSGSFVGDIAGDGYHGTGVNIEWKPADYSPSVDPQALEFNGSSAYVDTADFDIGDDFTIAAWVRADDASAEAILAKNTISKANFLVMGLYNDTYHFRIRGETWSSVPVITGEWTHIVFTGWLESNGGQNFTHVTFYLNGQRVEEFTLLTAVGQVDGGLPWTIGQEWDPGGRSDFFDGLIDDVRIYDNLLSPAEVRALSEEFQALCSLDPGGNVSLTFAIDSGVCDEIHLASGTYPASEVETANDLSIKGLGQNSTFIDLGDNGRFLKNIHWNLILEDLHIFNGSYTGAAPGGILYNQKTMTLNSVTLAGNDSTVEAGGLSNSGRVSLQGVWFLSNKGASGGGMFNSGHASLNQVEFQYNNSGGGGAILNTGALTLTNSTLNNNTSDNSGGGILNYGVLRMTGAEVSENKAVGLGGGIYNDDFSSFAGDADIRHSRFLTNSAGYSGGGIANAGTLSLADSSVLNNNAQSGGGIYNSQNANEMVIDNSSVVANESPGSGGGMLNEAIATIRNSTISGNRRTTMLDGAGLVQSGSSAHMTVTHLTITGNTSETSGTSNGLVTYSGVLTVSNTLLVDNGAGSANCAISNTTLVQMGNLSDDSSCPGFPMDATAAVMPLADNDGPTKTHALPEVSPARGAGAASSCLLFDQRSVPRGSTCDAGAYEFGTLNQVFLPALLR